MRRRFVPMVHGPGASAAARLEASRRLAHRLEPYLSAFVELEAPLIGRRSGPLADVSFAVQDVFPTALRAPTIGLPRPLGRPEAQEIRAVRQLEEAGAVRLGFTEMTTLGLDPTGWNGLRAMPRNPWQQEHVTGGAASGAGVAVASGAVAFALGLDRQGDLRVPAHCLGITAWVPTEGVSAAAGGSGFAPTLERLGVLARSAIEIERVATVLTADAREKPVRVPPAVARIAVAGDLRDGSETSVRRAIADGLDALESSGARLDLVRLAAAVALLDRRARDLLAWELARALRPIAADTDVKLDQVTRGRLGSAPPPDERTAEALARERKRLVREFEETFFSSADALALPVMAERTPPIERAHADQPSFDPALRDRMTRLVLFANYLGLPVVAVPLGRDDRGLPTALQLIGRRGGDAGLLAAAARLQARTEWHGRLPEAISDIVSAEEDLLS